MTGIGADLDFTQILLYMFWAFFIGLLIYLRREDKREGYPLESDRSDRITVQGFPPIPKPKEFKLRDGTTRTAPRDESDSREIRAKPAEPWPGAPLEPTGDPMQDGVGPAAYAARPNTPDRTLEGQLRIVPLRIATDHSIAPKDPDPRGMDVVGADGKSAGTVSDAWVDRAEALIRYLEVDTSTPAGTRRVLLPITLARISGGDRTVKVDSVFAKHFEAAPTPASDMEVTMLEEDRICAYFASGHLYAEPSRQEPLL